MSMEVSLFFFRALPKAQMAKWERMDWSRLVGAPLVAVTSTSGGTPLEVSGWVDHVTKDGPIARFCSLGVVGWDLKSRCHSVHSREHHVVLGRKMPATRVVDGLRVSVLQVESDHLKLYIRSGVARNVQAAGFQIGDLFIPTGRQPGRKRLEIGLAACATWEREPSLTSVP